MKYLGIFFILIGSFNLSGNSFAQTPAKGQKPEVTPIQVQYNSIPAVAAETNIKLKKCEAAANRAKLACLTEYNESIQVAGGMIGTILGSLGMAKSPSQSCEKYNKAMKIAETALIAYNSLCTAMQVSCESSCGLASTTLDADIPKIQAAANINQAAKTDMGSLKIAKGVVQKELATCSGYKMNLAAAGLGLTNVLKQSAAASMCEKTTTVVDCAKDPYNSQCAKAMDCSKQENYNQTYCICQRSPNTPSCPGYSGQSIVGTPTVNQNNSPTNNDKFGNYNPAGPSDTIAVDGVHAKGTGSGIGSGNGSSGLSGLGGSGTGGTNGLAGANKVGGADAKKAKILNPNIIEGFDGSGGGGGSSGSSRTTASEDSAYRAYLPGGQKDPTAGANKMTYSNEVTGSGAKSNWEKIREIYLEKQPTFVGN